jgi:hypothetical protein
MLPLDSPRWSELDVFFGESEQAPIVLKKWIDAIGFDQERTIYERGLYQLFLHQGTITNLAFAVVPWIVEHCRHAEISNRMEYIADVALVELNRLTCGVHYVRDGGDTEPEWLMADYKHAIEQAQTIAEDLMDEAVQEERRSHLWRMMPALFGNAELAQQRRSQAGPKDE